VIELFHSFRDALYNVLLFFQDMVYPIMGSQSYWFSIVLLTVSVRILLIPLTVKQVKSTRVMQELAPEIKKLQAKHKNDKTKLNEEMMALYKERGFNPLAGCWPLLAQMPFFFALYQVIYAQEIEGAPNVLIGKTFFGVPLQQHWLALQGWDKIFSAAGLTILVLTTIMSLTTYISQRQLMSKQTAAVNPQQQTIMRVMPLLFFVFAVNVPLAVIIYWVTTNFWSVGQQYFLLRAMPLPATADAQAAPAGATALVDNDNGEGRKGLLGPLSMFRGSAQSRASGERSQTNKNGSRNARSGDTKASSKQGGPASKQGGAQAKQGGAQAKQGGPASKQGGAQAKQGGPASKQGGTANRQGGGPASKGAAARPAQSGRQGTSGNRRSGSRSSGKGKSSGPRRGKR
jgi:YidC/Oxa1 family membrane protein insertase